MPLFKYKAISPSGVVIQDTMEAESAQIVAEKLDKQGYLPLRISQGKIGKKLDISRVKLDEIIIFTRQLVTLLKAGIPLLSSLEALSEQTTSEKMKGIIREIYMDIEGGASLSEALAKHPRVFSRFYINSVRAGEASGSLDDVLERMGSTLQYEKERSSAVKSAMRYPLIVVIAICIAFVVMTTVVVPKFIPIFSKFGAELPLPTRILMGVSSFIKKYWYVLLSGLGGLSLGFMNYIKTDRGRYQWDSLKLKLPAIGPLVLKTSMSRFARMFETLNKSGLPILQTLDIVSKTVGNVVVGREVEKAIRGVRKGEGIAKPLKESKLFTPMVVRMIAIGEQSGSLDQMLASIAEHYDLEVDYALKKLTSMIEPLLTVGIGAVVLLFALAIFLPMWDMLGIIR